MPGSRARPIVCTSQSIAVFARRMQPSIPVTPLPKPLLRSLANVERSVVAGLGAIMPDLGTPRGECPNAALLEPVDETRVWCPGFDEAR
jgi:hypothetical protein